METKKNAEIKSLIQGKNSLYQRQIKYGSIGYAFSNALTLDISNALSCSKVKYYESLGLFPPRTAPETY